MNIKLNYFELFQLPVSCELNVDELSSRSRALLREFHPDRFIGDSECQKRLSVQYSAYINDAYIILKSPLSRYIYMLQMADHKLDMEYGVPMDSSFLIEQMTLRESVAEIREQASQEERLHNLMSQVADSLEGFRNEFSKLWESGHKDDLDQAKIVVCKMQFMDKIKYELEQLESD